MMASPVIDGVTVPVESRPSRVSRPFRYMLWRLARPSGIAPIVASSGRAGSTMLFDALPRALMPIRPLRSSRRASIWLTETAWDLQGRHYRPGIVYKTHDYPPDRPLPRFTRVIYTFSDPTEVVFSLLKQDRKLGRGWIDEHYRHLRAPGGDFDRITEADTLRLADHFHAWTRPQAFPLLCIKYSALWSSTDEISRFLGVPITLPAYKPRGTDLSQISPEDVEKVRHTYAELIREIDAAADCSMFPAIDGGDR